MKYIIKNGTDIWRGLTVKQVEKHGGYVTVRLGRGDSAVVRTVPIEDLEEVHNDLHIAALLLGLTVVSFLVFLWLLTELVVELYRIISL